MPNCEYQQINFGLELWKGAYASVRPSECGLTWNVDSANVAFLTCVDLLELAEYHYNCRRGPELKKAIEQDRDGRETGASFLKLYRDRKIKTQTGFKKKINSFGPDTSFKFALKEVNKPEVQISIKDYLKKQYNITLQYPDLPCINLGKTSYLPMELCKTELTQKKNLSDKETADIIKWDHFSKHKLLFQAHIIFFGVESFFFSTHY
jgi:eukaryotic translation initiation factor 2C